jgi:hypothetical protein
VLSNALLDTPSRLNKLLTPDPKDPARQDAYQKIQTLMLSPVLRAVLCKQSIALDNVVLARLDRAVLGDFDAFVLASFLVSQFKGQVVIPAFGFYGRDFHTALIRQNRLTAGLNYLAEIKSEDLQQALLTIPQKRACRALFDDAEVLARDAGLRPDPLRAENDYNDFIAKAMA